MMKRFLLSLSGICFSLLLTAQVQVSKEPMHRPVLENKYVRILDVEVKKGDTTAFHIHSTPSMFVYRSSVTIATQVKGEKWVKEKTETGKAWFRSFSPDSLVHRVANADSLPLLVNDIEILNPYHGTPSDMPLPYSILFENEQAFGYRVSREDITEQVFKERGPIVAILVSGEGVQIHDVPSDEQRILKPGQFAYINPATYFSIKALGTGPVNLVLFEVR